MKSIRSLLCLAIAACAAFTISAPDAKASSLDNHPTVTASVATQDVSAPTKSPLGPIGTLSMLGFAIAGATEAKQRKLTLRRTYLFEGNSYGPGRDVLVPEGFPELDNDGNVKHPEGSFAAANAAKSRPQTIPAGTASIDSSETVSGKTFEELSEMKKSELEDLAIEAGLDVTRGDGSDGAPLVEDYVKALSAPAAK